MVRDVVTCDECVHADAFRHCSLVNFWNTTGDYCSRGIRKTNGVYDSKQNSQGDNPDNKRTMEEFMAGILDWGNPEDGSL